MPCVVDFSRLLRPAAMTLLVALLAGFAAAQPATTRLPADPLLEASGISGGLLVQIGACDVTWATKAAATGRFLVHVLIRDPAALDKARQSIQAQGLYGLVSADQLEPSRQLPYTENLINLLAVDGSLAGKVSLAEMTRVLCPRGVLMAAGDRFAEADLRAAGLEDLRTVEAGRWVLGRKPWPKAMDQWTHPRHAADGNPVAQDQLVGPARRIRWVAGPAQEISNMVSAYGRNFYAGVLARDGFNGLRLWQCDLDPSPARGGYGCKINPGSVRPVAADERLFVVSRKTLTALDGATGKELRTYPEAGEPSEILHCEGVLIAVDATAVRAVEVATGRLRWKQAAAEPRCVVAAGGGVYFVQGEQRRGQKCAAIAVDLATGKVRWQHDDYPWLSTVRACVAHAGLLALETSTLSDNKPGNVLRVVSAADGSLFWEYAFVPGMAHMKQARAMFVGDQVWVLDDKKCAALDARTGKVQKTYAAGWGHCFPPVATEKYLFAGELDMTDLATGRVDANRITKGACSRDAGYVLANGLINAFPKHCVCWPMLRGYAAMAAALPGEEPLPAEPRAGDFPLERGPAEAPRGDAAPERDADWPCYRHDAWRSGSTRSRVPTDLKVLWKTDLGAWPAGPIADDWRQNDFVRGPVTAPVSAGGLVYVARPDGHQVVALDAQTGKPAWTFTANGRIDTAPTIHRGLCLFGAKSGWVYCLRADDGRLVRRLRAAPRDRRIVAYGQIESPWPVPGSVLVIDGIAFFAAGRQPLADGGILVFAVEPATGKILWVKRLDSVPQKAFYESSALEFVNFDLLHQEGDSVALSRWLFQRRSGQMTCQAKSGFAQMATGGTGVMAPRGFWSYAPRNESEEVSERPFVQPLAVFRDSALFGGSEDRLALYRRDFRLGEGESFDTEWFHKWTVLSAARKGAGDMWRSQRLARGAKWTQATSEWLEGKPKVNAMLLAPGVLFVVGNQGGLAAVATDNGKLLGRTAVPPPLWDGLAAASGRLLMTTQDGRIICLGAK